MVDHKTQSSFQDRRWFKSGFFIFYLFIFLLLCTACASTRYVTHTKKSGVEQLLVSRALDRALEETTLDVKRAKIFIEVASLLPEQDPYIKKALEHWLLKNGALLIEDKKKADYIVSVLAKSVGTDGSEFSFGLPSMPVPLMNINTPQISIISGLKQKGYVEMEVFLYLPEVGLKEKTGPLIGKSYFNKYTVIFIPFTTENIY
jgi:hypothetical protein